ncbi:MAG: HEPN domain-containing protein [Chloroflexi bacterium]|nr:HEPN domain-containing protein [Chloroflexota bacterium]
MNYVQGDGEAIDAGAGDIEKLLCRIEPCISILLPSQFFPSNRPLLGLMLKSMIAAASSPLRPLEFLDLCRRYISAAEIDCKDASILYAGAAHSGAVYHLQQAVEKGMKAFCLALGIATPESLRNTHRTPQPLLQALKAAYLVNFERLFSNVGGKDYRRLIKQVDVVVNSEQKSLARLPFTSTRGELGISRLFATLDNISDGRQRLEDTEVQVKEAVAQCLPEYRDAALSYSTNGIGIVGIQYYILGALTFPHESYTRYPGKVLEPWDYNKELGIVQAVPELLNRVPIMIEELRRYVEC